ncbi:unnamed protein product [Trichobilharzia regenti]|nr:unnamed protein product [Trichobilharzia regenti]
MSLCSSAHSIPRECTVSDESCEDLDENDGTKISCLPMPTNVAVSYNNNSLVVPHARLFNDSSICISPDGRLLAAFVIPRETSYSTLQSSSNLLKTILAVYRLQPEHNRGQCEVIPRKQMHALTSEAILKLSLKYQWNMYYVYVFILLFDGHLVDPESGRENAVNARK